MRILKLTLALFFFSNFSIAQVQINYGRTYSDIIPEAFKLDVSEMRQHIYEGIPEGLKGELYDRAAFRFSDQTGLMVKEILTSGDVYSDWPAFENYLNDIFNKVIPEELKSDKVIHAYLLKNGGFNAFMTPSGMTFVNIGVFADIHNEATIAGILAHELSHYHLRHSLKSFIKAERGEFKQGIFGKNKNASKFSIANELQADSLAMVWIQNSGYHIDGLIEGFKIMQRMEENAISRMEKVWELEETTHPLSGERLSRLLKFKSEHQSNQGELFLVGEGLFRQFQEEAKPEILKHLLNNFAYYSCIENAFKFHIGNPDSPVFLYYLMEGIRRNCYLRPELWKERFITDRYYDVVKNEDEFNRHKEKMKSHLFEKVPYKILGFNPVELKKQPGYFYWQGDLKFINYEQAFEFFYRVSEIVKAPECVLSNALSLPADNELRKELLEKYLAFPEIQYRDYAESLLKGTIREKLKDKKLLVLSSFESFVRQGDEDIPLRIRNEEDAAQISNVMEKVMLEFKDRRYFTLEDMRYQKVNDYKLLKELEQFSFMYTISKGQKTELHILDPRYWQALYQFEVNEIEFLNCSFMESRKSEKSVEAYEEVINSNFMDIASQEKRTKYLEIFVTSIREKERGVMKVKYYGGDNKLKFKQPAYDQIVSVIQSRIRGKEKAAQELDNVY